MKRLFFITFLLAALFFTADHSQAQYYNNGIFNAFTSDTTTLEMGDASLSTNVIMSSYTQMVPEIVIHGYAKVTSDTTDTSCTLTVTVTQIHGNTSADLDGTAHTMGTVVATGSAVKYKYTPTDSSWWDYAKGYNITFTPDTSNAYVLIKSKLLAR